MNTNEFIKARIEIELKKLVYAVKMLKLKNHKKLKLCNKIARFKIHSSQIHYYLRSKAQISISKSSSMNKYIQ